MFRYLSIVIFVLSSYWVFKLFKKNDVSLIKTSKHFLNSLNKSWKDLCSFRSNNVFENLQSLRSFVLLITLLEFDIMVITGFAPIIFIGDNLTGIFLLIHVTIAPLIAVSFAVLVVLFAHSNRFNSSDVSISVDEDEKKRIQLEDGALLKINFWLISLFSLPAMLSIILGMFPLFGTEGQLVLLEIHKYSVLIITILVILHMGMFSVKLKSNNNEVIKEN
ncbi:MAG: hypothetical protein ABFS12_05685 [Bacteroidota bacterium]